MSRALALALWLWFFLPLGAEPVGILSYLTRDTAIFLHDSEEITFRVSGDLARKLAQQGVGSQWEYSACDDPMKWANLKWVIYRGISPDLRNGLDALSQYMRQGTDVPGRDVTRPIGKFPGREPRDFRSNWQLTEVHSFSINVSVHYSGCLDRENGSILPSISKFTINREGSRWSVKTISP